MDIAKYVPVIVIGGGPGGSTVASLLAKSGIDVMILERDTFPRYHIGESLSASCRWIIDLTGAREQVERAGFPRKYGVLFRWGIEEDWTVEWEKAVGPNTYSWQVDRAIFDEVLLNNCKAQGATVLEGAKVDEVLFQDARACGVKWRLPDGTSGSTQCDYVVDASGRAGVLAVQRFANREMDERYRNVATWGYWQDMETIPGGPQGAINVVSAPAGWYWLIPLSDGRTSVGYVTGRDVYRANRSASATVEELYLRYIAESETLSELTAGGRFAGTVHVEQDYSYCARSFSGPGYVMVGDAACFIDPLLSTGVHLAMYSGFLAAASLVSVIDGMTAEERAFKFFETAYRNAYQRMQDVVSAMYAQYDGSDSYFWQAYRLLRDKGNVTPKDAFRDIIAGAADLNDVGETPADDSRTAEPGSETGHEHLRRGELPDLRGLFTHNQMQPDGQGGFLVVIEPRLGLEIGPRPYPALT